MRGLLPAVALLAGCSLVMPFRPSEEACIPRCDERQCGADGCGGLCPPGCGAEELCRFGQCESCPHLFCAGTCCAAHEICRDGVCLCTPDCGDRECGDDGCGGECAPGCGNGERCDDEGSCECAPSCAGRECGDDGCGGDCPWSCTVAERCNLEAGRCEALVLWEQVETAASPPAREDHEMAWSADEGATVLFGGYAPGGSLGDTWLFGDGLWVEGPSGPSARRYHAMAAGPPPLGVVLFGGVSGPTLEDTWELVGGAWSELDAAAPEPARTESAMAPHAGLGGVVLHGGFDGFADHDDTWLFDGTSWVELGLADAPTPRRGAAAAYDSRRGVLVLFGGLAVSSGAILDDTWELDGEGWRRRSFAPSPPGRSLAGMAFDSSRGVIVLFGGKGDDDAGDTYLGDTWELDGESWVDMTTPGSPSGRYGHAMAYDPTAGQVVLFGGYDGRAHRADTWTYRGP